MGSSKMGSIGREDAYKTAAENAHAARMAKLKKSTAKSSKKKKKLNYNHWELSSLLLRAERPASVSSVMIIAKGRLSNLKRCAASGEFNRREVANAIAHVGRIVQCAKLKSKNLQEEELEERLLQEDSGQKEPERKARFRQKVRQRKRQLEQEISGEQQKELQELKRRYLELERKQRRHRREEYGKVAEADMKYYQGQSAAERGSVCMQGPAAVLELRAKTIYVDEKQIEQQVEQEMAGSVPSGSSSSAGSQSSAGLPAEIPAEAEAEAGMDAAAVSASVDVMV